MNLKITFYVGVDSADKDKFMTLYRSINESVLYRMEIEKEYDNLYGYYTYCIKGNWDSYKRFLDGPDFIKSVEHFEDF